MTPELLAFGGLVALVGVQRLVEVGVSNRNEIDLLASGGRVHFAAQMTEMRLLHGLWLIAILTEVVLAWRPFELPVACFAAVVFVAGQLLRMAAMSALGRRWTVSVVSVPGEHAVARGVFRWFRHPNYVGVCLEMAALPMLHGAWITATIFTLWNAALLSRRVRVEDRLFALAREASPS